VTGWGCVGGSLTTADVCSPICGDGLRVGFETCDDGLVDTRGCNSTCTGVVSGFSCSLASVPGTTVCTVVCGDMIIISPDETCDDSNTANNDGCSSSCLIEPNWFCNTSFNPSSKSNCSICGDGKNAGGGEVCDDGNIVDNLGCSSDCTGVITGWTCTNINQVRSTPVTCSPICGDGILVGIETCDDGNSPDNKGCNSTCTGAIPGYSCIPPPNAPTTCVPICGDGKVMPDEICDDGNKLDNKGCLGDCTGIINGWYCTAGTTTSPSVCNTLCGDGIVVSLNGETCDDGNSTDNFGCLSNCLGVITGYSCGSSFANGTTNCTFICGDG